MPREIQEGTSWFPFFRPFFVERQRKGIFAITERAKLGEAVGEVVKDLANLPLFPAIPLDFLPLPRYNITIESLNYEEASHGIA